MFKALLKSSIFMLCCQAPAMALAQCSVSVAPAGSCTMISFAISTIQTFQPGCTGNLTTVVAPNISIYSDDLRMTGHSVIARIRSSTGTLLASSNVTDQWYPGATVTFSFPCSNLILTSGTTYRLEFYDTTTTLPQEVLALFCRSTSSVYAGGNVIQDGVPLAAADLYGWTVNIAGNMAAASSVATQVLTPSSCATYFNGSNEAIAQVQSGSIAMGSTTAKVTVQGSASSFNGQPYVRRFYDITPTTNKSTATSNITLFFSQADFNDFNALNGSYPDLPTGPSDLSGIANLRITQEHGTSATGAPGTFTGWAGAGPANVLITPGSVSWNSAASRWEVSFPVTGFSGFFAHTGTGVPLSISVLNFNAKAEGNGNSISWQTGAEDEAAFFEIERSSDAFAFSTIGSVNSSGATHNYSYYDANPHAPVSYYRLRYAGNSGDVLYSNILAVNRNEEAGFVSVSPLPAHDVLTITSTPGPAIGQPAAVLDMQGRVVYRFNLELTNQLAVHTWPAGVYTLHLSGGRVLRIVKQ